MSLSYIALDYQNTDKIIPDLIEVYELLAKIQIIFPNMFITSNRAEQFNSVHDRAVSYRGRKTPRHANNRLKSWILFKYCNKGLKYYLIRNPVHLPMSILQNCYHLQFDSVKFI